MRDAEDGLYLRITGCASKIYNRFVTMLRDTANILENFDVALAQTEAETYDVVPLLILRLLLARAVLCKIMRLGFKVMVRVQRRRRS